MTDTYITIGQPPNSRVELLMYEILCTISEKVGAFYDEHVGIRDEKDARITNLEMICMISTNVLVNLLHGAVKKDISSEDRLKVINTCLEEVSRISLNLWMALEANRATKDVSH